MTVRAVATTQDATIEVLDEGPGPGPDPDALFGLFYRSPHTAQRATGTGIGLYVARELSAAMGGSIAAAARPSGGAVFSVCLPLAEDDDAVPRKDGRVTEPTESAMGSRRRAATWTWSDRSSRSPRDAWNASASARGGSICGCA